MIFADAGPIDVQDFLTAVSRCKYLTSVELEAEISDEQYSDLERELKQRRIEFSRLNTRNRYLMAIGESEAKDKYDFAFQPDETAYLIEDHGSKYLKTRFTIIELH